MIKAIKKMLGFVEKDTYNKDFPYKWDINHMGHDFSSTKTYQADMRKCEKCSIYVYHNSQNNRYNTFNPMGYRSGTVYPTLDISCNEMIIKRLLE